MPGIATPLINRAKAQEYLLQVDENIEKAEIRIKRHEAQMKKLVAIGYSGAAAKSTLQTLKKLVGTMRNVREQFRRLAGNSY